MLRTTHNHLCYRAIPCVQVQPYFFHMVNGKQTQITTWLLYPRKMLEKVLLAMTKAMGISVPQAYVALKTWCVCAQ
jgi:hypothetical protein